MSFWVIREIIYENINFIKFNIIFLASCQSVQDGLTGKKRSDSNDEFFVIKKNPLTMPPDYDKLPKPLEDEGELNEDSDIKTLISDKTEKKIENSSGGSSLEESILEKINE